MSADRKSHLVKLSFLKVMQMNDVPDDEVKSFLDFMLRETKLIAEHAQLETVVDHLKLALGDLEAKGRPLC